MERFRIMQHGIAHQGRKPQGLLHSADKLQIHCNCNHEALWDDFMSSGVLA